MKKYVGFALFVLAVAGRVMAADGDLADVSVKDGWNNLSPVAPVGSDWAWWRGPSLDNVAAAGQKPPLKWGATENVLWKVTLPGVGHSSPTICGERIFLTAGDAAQKVVWLMCFDRATGKKTWQTEIYKGPFAKIHGDNSPASGTPPCDGERVYVPYQTDTMVCIAAVDLDGKIAWNRQIALYTSIQGYSASPAFYKSAVIVPTDGGNGNKLTALHRKTGEVVWRVTMKKVTESYATPLVANVAGRDQLVLIGGETTRGYDPNNGNLLWECNGPATWCSATPVFGKDTVYSTGGYPQKAMLAIKADGAGDVTKTHLSWKSDNKAGYVPSPLLHEGLLYAVSDTGLMRCYDAADGKVVWEEKFKAPFYSSPVLVGDRLYVFDRKGKGYVMKAGRQFELLAVNELPEGAFATPVFLGGRMYLRTLADFYCIGEK